MGQLSKIVTREAKRNLGKLVYHSDSFTGHWKIEHLSSEMIMSLLDYFCLTFF